MRFCFAWSERNSWRCQQSGSLRDPDVHHVRRSPRCGEDFVTKFEKALRKRYQHLKTELAKIEHLIDAFEKGAKRGAKPTGRGKISAAGRKRISMAQKAR